MTITISLPQATVEKLQAQAAASGKDLDTLVREAVEVKLAIAGRSFRDIMAPVHQDFVQSGMTEEGLDALTQESLTQARAARKNAKPS